MYFHTLLPILMRKYCLHFTDKKTEAHRDYMTFWLYIPCLSITPVVLKCGLHNHQGTWFENADSGSEAKAGRGNQRFKQGPQMQVD